MDTIFQSGHRIGIGPSSLRDILAFLEKTYCSSVGVEYKFVRNPEVLQWLEEKMEGCSNAPDYSVEEQLEHLKNINEAVGFESFLHTKFVGQKRFSLEGSEAIIPALDTLVEKGAMLGVEEFIIGMAHRGRLNVLANILGKPYEDIFMEFEGKMVGSDGFDGDVKYHMGHSSDRLVRNGNTVHLSLTPNPSHLEAVNPVVAGISRGKIDRRYHGDVDKLVPILIHGDASIAGQGIVYEVLQMSQLPGYHIGGTVHVVLNNQVGFTADYFEGRSSTYCTDVAKTTLSPVFHVNGDDLDAVAYVTELALNSDRSFIVMYLWILLRIAGMVTTNLMSLVSPSPLSIKKLLNIPIPSKSTLNVSFRKEGSLNQRYRNWLRILKSNCLKSWKALENRKFLLQLHFWKEPGQESVNQE